MLWHNDSKLLSRLKFKLTGDADYVQPGLLSPAEQQRLESMDLGPVIAEVAATSCTHRKLASQRAQKEEHTTSGTSRYLGVHKRGRRWFFKFKRKADDRTTVRQATFDSEEEAARGYDKLAWETDGWCGCNNFHTNTACKVGPQYYSDIPLCRSVWCW